MKFIIDFIVGVAAIQYFGVEGFWAGFGVFMLTGIATHIVLSIVYGLLSLRD